MAIEFTDANFKEKVLDFEGLSVIDFWAEWCGPCRMISPIIQELAEDYGEKVRIGKLNVDDNPEVSMQYGIRSIPTILFVKNGEVVHKHVGATTKQALADKIEEFNATETVQKGAIEFTDANFKEKVLDFEGLSVIDFWAEWCGPCRMISPIIQELAEDYGEKVRIGKLNVDDNPEVSMQYGIRSIPTILFVKNGEVIHKHVGATTKQALADKIEENL